MPRPASTHAAGVVITRNPAGHDYVPLAKNDEAVVTQYTMTTLEELGLFKMDFLGLRNLTILDDAVKMVQGPHPDFRLKDIPDDDRGDLPDVDLRRPHLWGVPNGIGGDDRGVRGPQAQGY